MKNWVLAVIAIVSLCCFTPAVQATDGYGVVVQSVAPTVVLQSAVVHQPRVVVQQVHPVVVQKARPIVVQQVHPVVVQQVQKVQAVRVQAAHPVVVQNVIKSHPAVVTRSVQVSRPALFRGFRR